MILCDQPEMLALRAAISLPVGLILPKKSGDEGTLKAGMHQLKLHQDFLSELDDVTTIVKSIQGMRI